jgi:2-oxoglutarate dehydrogenase E2 component (dihydrolipoamide succinyltransferase)
MSAVEIKVPGVGESVTEGILARWLKPDGAAVQSGEPLFELETDKASNVVPAMTSGVLKIRVAEGETVEIGATIGTLDPSGTPSAAPAAASAAKAASQAATAKGETAAAPRGDGHGGTSASAAPSPSQAPAASNGGTAMPLSPAVRRLVAESGTDAAAVAASGPGGRLTKGDVLAHIDSPGSRSTTVEPAIKTPPPAPSPVAPALSSAPAAPAGRETRQRMSGLRQKIAQRLVEAQQTAAILTTFNEVDMTRVSELRARYKEPFQKRHDVALGFMSFFVKASIEALRAFPAVNARIDGNEIVYQNYFNIGVAVSTERGLMVPVIRDADALSFAGVEKAIGQFATKARAGTIGVDDLQGGTFTITNGGVFGSLLSTPILNPPQSGILGMHAIKKRPVVVDDQIVARPMMYLAFSYDHRIIDGREAVSFLVRIKDCIENPERLMLDV